MSVGVLVVTHNRLGEELVATVEDIMAGQPLPCASLAVRTDDDLGSLVERGHQQIACLDDGEGVLILTDAFGSTPSNVAVRLGSDAGTEVVSGVNLPMLLRIMNYPELDLAGLSLRAYTGGRDGVIRIDPPASQRADSAGHR
jgi:PTS system ascorbate-specific IIA component